MIPESPTERDALHDAIRRIAGGPKHAKSLSRSQARAATEAILDPSADSARAGIFLIALRMKRESAEEYLGVLDALRECSSTAEAEVSDLVCIADPYDGYTRNPPITAWLPAVLAACGLPSFTHGVTRLGPKHGLTARQALVAAGAPVTAAPETAARWLAEEDVGWSFLDQAEFAPALSALAELRDRVVKRTVLNTVERVLAPLLARRRTHLWIGYTHGAYVDVYADLAQTSGFASALLVRGEEGGVVSPTHKPARVNRVNGGTRGETLRPDPRDIGVEADLGGPRAAAAPDPWTAAAAARAGLDALAGAPGPVRASLVWSAALCLWHCGAASDLRGAAERVRDALDSGAALAHFGAPAKHLHPAGRIPIPPTERRHHA